MTIEHHDIPGQPVRRRRRTIRRIIVPAILLLIASPFLAYAVLAVRFYSGKPNPTHDYYADYNTMRNQYPDDDRAWGFYMAMTQRVRELVSDLNQIFDQISADGGIDFDDVPDPFAARPGDPFFAAADAALSATTLLSEARAAARRPIIGTLATDRYANEPPTSPADFLPPGTDPTRQTALILLLITPLGDAHNAAKILIFDAHRAIREEDAERAVENIRDIIRIARQCEREPGLLPDLVAIAIAQRAAEAVGEIIERNPTALNDTHLHELIPLFLTEAPRAAVIDFTHEWMVQQDIIQRVYTDDGRGNGRITPVAFFVFDLLQSPRPPPLLRVLAPIAAVLTADRQQQSSMLNEGIESAQQVVVDPAAHYPKAAQRLKQLEYGGYLVSRLIEPALLKAAGSQIQAHTLLQATAARLALERYRLTEGHYPDTLADLVPTYLPELPQDPFNPGHPINYLLRDGLPILYSVGSNGIDDGATPAPEGTNPADLEARFADPSGPSSTAPNADWILYPPKE